VAETAKPKIPTPPSMLSSLKIMALELLEYGAAISVTLLVFQETSSFSVASLVTEIHYFIAEESSTISSLNLVNF